jgi:hypothetical protein
MKETSTTELINIKDLTPSKIFNVDLFKENQKKLAKDNPIIEIVDEATYKKSDTSRKALKKGRTTLQNSKKIDLDEIKKVLVNPLSTTYDEIVEITEPLEKEHEKACKVWEEKVAEEERVAAVAETLRKTNIQTKISGFQDTWNDKLTKLDFEGIEAAKTALEEFNKTLNLEEDFQEFQIEFSVKHQAITDRLNSAVTLLTQNEETRLENEKLTTYNTRLEYLLSLGSKLTELGITLPAPDDSKSIAAFVSKENLKQMDAKNYAKVLKTFEVIKKEIALIALAEITAKETLATAPIEIPVLESEVVPVVKIPAVNSIPTSIPSTQNNREPIIIRESKPENKLIGWDLVVFEFLKETQEGTVQELVDFLTKNYNPPTKK